MPIPKKICLACQALNDQVHSDSSKTNHLSTHGVDFAHSQESKKKPPVSFLTIEDLAQRIARGRSTIYEMMNVNNKKTYDPLLPEPVHLGRNIVWPSDEIDTYIEERVAASRLISKGKKM